MFTVCAAALAVDEMGWKGLGGVGWLEGYPPNKLVQFFPKRTEIDIRASQ